MIKVGLTGGIGSGKSLIAKVFSLLGVSIYDSDMIAKQLYYTNNKLKSRLVREFGDEVYFKSGELNKPFLRKLIFQDKTKLALINSIIHPLVKSDFEQYTETHKNSAYIIKESAILIESEAYKSVDKVIVVTANKNERISRVCKRDQVTPTEVINRMNNQLTDDERIKYADFVIYNNNNELLLPQILNIDCHLKTLINQGFKTNNNSTITF